MTRSSFRRSGQQLVIAAATGALALTGLAPAGVATAATAPAIPAAGNTSYTAGSYIVLLSDAAATTYEGGASGLPATRATSGTRFDAKSDAVQKYSDHLRAQQAKVAAKVGATRTQSFTLSSNGFAAHLTGQQATTLARTSGVLAVVKDRLAKPDTTSSPEFLGLTKNGQPVAPWAPATAGKGVVVGVVDSGYWPENPSFVGAPLPKATSVSTAQPGPAIVSEGKGKNATESIKFAKADGGTFSGTCQAGQQFKADTCNTKVISARFFDQAFSNAVPKKDWGTTEFDSPRDGGGHGSHTSSTAVGNSGVDVTIEGNSFGKASGMAPAAKLAVYKVCWEAKTVAQTGCYNSDSVAAIDQAVEDGVDVLNFSISGTLNNPIDPVEMSFFGAAAAGIFVATSAGNSGPDASTVAHPSPWLTTVAASTHHNYEGTVVTGTTKVKGASVTVPDAGLAGTLVLSSASGVTGANPTALALCGPGTLDPAKVTGKIVNCDRGTFDRVAKSAEVKRAGGIGMVLTNVTPGSLDADFHSVPTIHVSHADRPAVQAAAGSAITLRKGDLTGGATTPLPQIASFSSRGPSSAAAGDLLKPDVSAPGVSVVAAVAPPSNSGRNWDLYSGTSMSSPHIAGLAAYYLSQHPTQSPMAVKSAMMTTASNLKNADGSAYTDPFGQGAGHVDPTNFFDPGVVFDSAQSDWWDYLAGQGVTFSDGTPVSDKPIDASDLNVPSLAIGDLAGVQTVTRTITNVANTKETYGAAYKGDSAIAVTFDKPKYDVKVGGSAPLRIKVAATGSAYDSYAKGFITLTGNKGHVVRIPVAVQPLRVKAPAEASGTGASGSATLTGTAGFTGALTTRVTGLAGATPVPDSVAVGGFDPAAPAPGAATKQYDVSVPAGTDYVRLDTDATNDADDLDLYVYKRAADGTLTKFATSATGSADERVSFSPSTAGQYVAFVNGFAAAGGGTSAYRWTAWTVPSAPVTPANLTVSPATQQVTTGQPFTVSATWAGLDTSQRWLGRVEYVQGGTPTGVRTVVTVN